MRPLARTLRRPTTHRALDRVPGWWRGEATLVSRTVKAADLPNMAGASLRGAAPNAARMDGADLSFANLARADLTGSPTGDLEEADLRGANLSGASLFGARDPAGRI